VILSNVDHAGFAGSLPRLGVEFAAVYTAEDIGSYKPDAANFDYLIAHVREDLGHGPDDILHVAQSLFHDHVPAKAHGLATAWIDRQGLRFGGSWGATREAGTRSQPDFTFATLAELAGTMPA
jgi:FMN phosphatase YigB (HAD superfamily)